MFRRVYLSALVLAVGLTSAARAQVKLEFKYPEETKTTNRSTTKTHQILSIMGMDLETESEESVVISSRVGKRNADGTLPVTQKIEAIRTQLSLPGGINVAFDTTDPAAKIDLPQLAFLGDVLKALVGAEYTLVLDGQNQVKFVQGTESFDAKLEGLNAQAAAVLRGRLNGDKMKRAFEQGQAKLPRVLAREGEPWETTEISEIGGDQTLTFKKRYEYQGSVEKGGKTLDRIGVRVSAVAYAMDPNSQSPIKATKSDLKIDQSEGTLLFDREAGKIVESKERIRIKGGITLTAGDKELPSTLDLTFDTASANEKSAK